MTVQDVTTSRPLPDEPQIMDLSGTSMDAANTTPEEGKVKEIYKVYKSRWLMLALFVLFSACNAMQWVQYTIINDIVIKYYGVPSTLVSWTSMVYMVTYVPLIFPASWLLDKTTSKIIVFDQWFWMSVAICFTENQEKCQWSNAIRPMFNSDVIESLKGTRRSIRDCFRLKRRS